MPCWVRRAFVPPPLVCHLVPSAEKLILFQRLTRVSPYTVATHCPFASRRFIQRARGQAENLIKAHKLHLASDRTSCTKATANQFRLLIHTVAYWLMLSLRGLAPRTSFWRDAQFDTIRLCLIKVAGRVTEMVTRIKIALPTTYPYQIGFATLAGRVAVNDGAVCPRTNPSAQPQTPI